jgi:ATP-binding cassette subfamily F protein 3
MSFGAGAPTSTGQPAPSAGAGQPGAAQAHGGQPKGARAGAVSASPAPDREERKRQEADRRKQQRARESLQRRIAELEGRIASREAEVKELEGAMAAPGFYENHEASRPVIDRHQALMWEVGDLMSQWEALQEHAADAAPES